MSFKVGQKLVNHIQFTGKTPLGYRFEFPLPELGEVYTYDGYKHTINGKDYIYIKELSWPGGHGYNAAKFRPVDFTFGEETAERIEKEINTKQLQPCQI